MNGSITETYVYDFLGRRAEKVTTVEGDVHRVLYIDEDTEERDGKIVRMVSVNGTRVAELGTRRGEFAATSFAASRVPKLWWLTCLVAAIFGLIVCIALLQVFHRFALNSSLSWSEELQIFGHIWIVFLGAAVAVS